MNWTKYEKAPQRVATKNNQHKNHKNHRLRKSVVKTTPVCLRVCVCAVGWGGGGADVGYVQMFPKIKKWLFDSHRCWEVSIYWHGWHGNRWKEDFLIMLKLRSSLIKCGFAYGARIWRRAIIDFPTMIIKPKTLLFKIVHMSFSTAVCRRSAATHLSPVC